MELMLTSFGVWDYPDESGGPAGARATPELFRSMPPVSMLTTARVFEPDFPVLMLAERIVMDSDSYDALARSAQPAYARVAEALQQLSELGFVRLVDFHAVLRANRDLLDRMVEQDLRRADAWLRPFLQSRRTWRRFWERHRSIANEAIQTQSREAWLDGDGELLGCVRYLPSDEDRRLENLQERLRPYLQHVNANIVISNDLGIAFHDWADFLPFYEHKFLAVARNIDTAPQVCAMRELFEISLPNLAIRDTKTLVKALQDPRIRDLRQLVAEAAAGRVQFDEDFGRRALADALSVERTAARRLRVIFCLTPVASLLGLCGAALQKGVEEAFAAAYRRKLERPHQWLLMLSDLSGRK